MAPPYLHTEIAEAIIHEARARRARWTLLDVTADEGTSTWVIRTHERGLVTRRYFFPFSTPRGVLTPSEIARLLLDGQWPFGESS